jgi:hypothetical protein
MYWIAFVGLGLFLDVGELPRAHGSMLTAQNLLASLDVVDRA